MDRRFESRLDEMLDQAEVTPHLLSDLLPRLERFLEPFVETLLEVEQKRHTAEYLSGLLSNLEHKTGEGIAYPEYVVPGERPVRAALTGSALSAFCSLLPASMSTMTRPSTARAASTRSLLATAPRSFVSVAARE